jgi:parallel beta-helix repeat protein
MNNLLNSSIEVQCDNIVINGAGFILQGVGGYVYVGITLSSRSNVTIKNIDLNQFAIGIRMNQSSNNIVTGNKIYSCCGVMLDSSSSNQIAGNNIISADPGYGYGVQINSGSFNTVIGNAFTDTGIGVQLERGEYNTISENNFKGGGASTRILLGNANHNAVSKNDMVGGGWNGITIAGSHNTVFGNNVTGKLESGISIYQGFNNTVYENYVANNSIGVSIGYEQYEFPHEIENNAFYRNNLVNNTQNVLIGNPSHTDSNFWDNGKEGNYWSDYTTKYPNATEIDHTGIGNTPYLIRISPTVIDRYPLIKPVAIQNATFASPSFTPPSISILSPQNKTYTTSDIPLTFKINETVTWIRYCLDSQANVTITGNTTLTGLSNGLHNLTVYAKDAFDNFGASETVYFTIALPSEPFPTTWIVAATAIIAIAAVAGHLFLKRKK